MDTTLPQLFIEYKDGGLVTVANSANLTDRVLIIGCALDGPTNKAVPISNVQDAENLFGTLIYQDSYLNPVTGLADKASAGNTLLKAMVEASLGGANNFLLVRVGGLTATVTGGFATALPVVAKYAGRVYNGTTINVTQGANTVITVTQNISKGPVLVYNFALTDTLRTVANTINNDFNNQSVVFTPPSTGMTTAASTLTAGTLTLSGGTNGTTAPGEDYATNASGLYNLLIDSTSGTFLALQDVQFDIGIMAAMYADDCVTLTTGDANATTKSVAVDYAAFLASVSKSNYPAYGTIGLRPINKTLVTDLTAYANANYLSKTAGWADIGARQIKFGYFMNQGFLATDADFGSNVDTGKYLMVPAGPDIFTAQKDLGLYNENGYAVLAGVLATIPNKDAATRFPLGSIAALTGEYSKTTHTLLNAGVGRDIPNRITGGGAYVTFKTYQDVGSPCIVQDLTAAQRGSDFQHLQILRICNLAVHLVRQAALPFIGKGMDVPARSALRTAIDSSLNILASSGALVGGAGSGYNFSISANPQEQVAGIINIGLQLRPSFQLRIINITVSVSQ